MTTAETSYDITRISFSVLFLGILILGCYLVLQPFLAACIWSTTIVVATWPVLLLLERKLKGRRGIAVTVMTAALLLIFVVPLWMAIGTIVSNSDTVSRWIQEAPHLKVPAPPDWLQDLPAVGPKIANRWRLAATADTEAMAIKLAPYLGKIFTWFLSHVGGFGLLFVHFFLTVILAAVLYAKGETAACGVRMFARRLGGEGGEAAVLLAAKAIRAVALGIILTALAQALLAGFGFGIAGIPFSLLLTALVFMSAIIQTGAPIITVPTAIWLFWTGSTGWGIFLLIWTIPIAVVDNFLRPILIKKGADLPLLLIFAGVIGGLLAFGIIGLFIGPVVLAVTYTLLRAWVVEGLDRSATNVCAPKCPAPSGEKEPEGGG